MPRKSKKSESNEISTNSGGMNSQMSANNDNNLLQTKLTHQEFIDLMSRLPTTSANEENTSEEDEEKIESSKGANSLTPAPLVLTKGGVFDKRKILSETKLNNLKQYNQRRKEEAQLKKQKENELFEKIKQEEEEKLKKKLQRKAKKEISLQESCPQKTKKEQVHPSLSSTHKESLKQQDAQKMTLQDYLKLYGL